MNDSNKAVAIGMATICLIILITSAFVLSLKSLHEYWERSAVIKGHARWVNGADGQAVWEWLPRCAPDQPAKESGKK